MPKKSDSIDRKSVILSDAERRNLRRKLTGSIDTAKQVLRPKTQINRLLERSQSNVKRISAGASEVVRNNVKTIGLIGVASALFAARRPISDWISRFRTRNVERQTADE